jgi:tetratricopeptide (TPR) repeat protein
MPTPSPRKRNRMRLRAFSLVPLLALLPPALGCLSGCERVGEAGVRAERDKGSLDAQLAAGREYLAAEEWNDAFVVFRRATLLDGRNYDAQLGLARACAKLGATDTGLDAAEAAAGINPEDPAPLVAAGRICLAARKLDEAVKYYKEALALDGALAEAWRGLGETRLLEGSLDGATTALEKARAVDANDADTRGKLGAVYAANEDYQKAAAEYRKAMELDPENARYPKALAWLLIEQDENLEEAEELARKARDLDPADTDAQVAEAAALLYRGEPEEAMRTLRGALDSVETNGDPYIYYAMACVARGGPGDYENALKALEYVRAMGLPHHRASQEEIEALIEDIKAGLTRYVEGAS